MPDGAMEGIFLMMYLHAMKDIVRLDGLGVPEIQRNSDAYGVDLEDIREDLPIVDSLLAVIESREIVERKRRRGMAAPTRAALEPEYEIAQDACQVRFCRPDLVDEDSWFVAQRKAQESKCK